MATIERKIGASIDRVAFRRGVRLGSLCGALAGIGLAFGIASTCGCTNEPVDLSSPCIPCAAGAQICVNGIVECGCGTDGRFYCTDCRISCGIIGYPVASCVEGPGPERAACVCAGEP